MVLCLKWGTAGALFFKIDYQKRLNDLSNMEIEAIADGETVVYDSVDKVFRPFDLDLKEDKSDKVRCYWSRKFN